MKFLAQSFNFFVSCLVVGTGDGCQCPGVLTPSPVSLTDWEVGKVIHRICAPSLCNCDLQGKIRKLNLGIVAKLWPSWGHENSPRICGGEEITWDEG